MIELKHIDKEFKGNIIFRDLNLELNTGKKIFIRGVNGCGKSVLLKLIVGYSKPDKGEVIVNGLVIGKDHDFIKNAGVSINAPEFVKSMSGLDNLMELAKIRKVASKADIEALATKLQLEGLKKKYGTYSLGMKQKMRIIQALMDKPNILILDEPFDALDKKSREIVTELLDEFIKQDTQNMLIYTSHDDHFELFADEVYLIEDQQIQRKTVESPR